MKDTTAARASTPTPRPARVYRRRQPEQHDYVTVAILLPVEQAVWLEAEAQKGFRSRTAQAALILHAAYLAAQEEA